MMENLEDALPSEASRNDCTNPRLTDNEPIENEGPCESRESSGGNSGEPSGIADNDVPLQTMSKQLRYCYRRVQGKRKWNFKKKTNARENSPSRQLQYYYRTVSIMCPQFGVFPKIYFQITLLMNNKYTSVYMLGSWY